MPEVELIILDADDTLWVNGSMYDQAINAIVSVLDAKGLDGQRWRDLQLKIDMDNVATFGFSKERFPTSSTMAYKALCREADIDHDLSLMTFIRSESEAVFDRVADPIPGVRESILWLARNRPEVPVVVLTKGDAEVQAKRLKDWGLTPYVDETKIVDRKDAEVFRAICDQYSSGDITNCWSVGNSLSSDILPALEVGLSAVWIPNASWAHESPTTEMISRAKDAGCVAKTNLIEALYYIGILNDGNRNYLRNKAKI